MMRAKKQAFAVRLLLSVVIKAAFSASATARGFCNIDGLGSKELQQDVRNAGATFFEAGSYMMTMLSAFERDDSDKIAVTLAAVRGLEWGKWIHNVGGMAMIAVFVGLILLPAWAVWRHRSGQPGIEHGMDFAFELPPYNLHSMALFGQMLVGALSGLEYIAIFAGESRQPERSITRSVWIASPIICAMFILGTGSVVALCKAGRHRPHCSNPADAQNRSGELRSWECGGDYRDFAAATKAFGRGELSVHRSYTVADGSRLGRSVAGVVYAIASAMEDAGEFHSLYFRAGAAAGGAGERRRPCAGGFSGAFECQFGALRADVHGDVCDSRGGGSGVAQIAARMAEVGFPCGILRFALQLADLGISLCQCGESVALCRKDCGDGSGKQYCCRCLLQAAAPANPSQVVAEEGTNDCMPRNDRDARSGRYRRTRFTRRQLSGDPTEPAPIAPTSSRPVTMMGRGPADRRVINRRPRSATTRSARRE